MCNTTDTNATTWVQKTHRPTPLPPVPPLSIDNLKPPRTHTIYTLTLCERNRRANPRSPQRRRHHAVASGRPPSARGDRAGGRWPAWQCVRYLRTPARHRRRRHRLTPRSAGRYRFGCYLLAASPGKRKQKTEEGEEEQARSKILLLPGCRRHAIPLPLQQQWRRRRRQERCRLTKGRRHFPWRQWWKTPEKPHTSPPSPRRKPAHMETERSPMPDKLSRSFWADQIPDQSYLYDLYDLASAAG